MKKFLKITSIFGILLMLLISTSFANGINVEVNEEAFQELFSSDLELLLSEETIETDLVLVQDNISIDNNVNGNIYVIGENVNISSENVDGDIFALGNEVTINSTVNGNIYVFASNLNISGTAKDMYVFAENIKLNENTTCRDIKTFTTNIDVAGNINRDLYVAAGEVKFSQTGKVGGVLSTTNENLNYKENVNEIAIIEDITADFKKSENQFEKFV